MVSDRDIEATQIIELHLNKDILFSDQIHADGFMNYVF